MQQVILFDLDGTLIDSTEAILESFRVAFKKFGRSIPSKEAILPQIGHPLFEMFVNLGVPEEEALKYVDAYRESYRKIHTKKTVLLPRAKEAVELAFKSGVKLGIVTTKTGKYSKELMEHFGLMDYFAVLIGSEDVKRHKPHPEPIERALELMGVSKSDDIVMIGDTCMDMLAAKRAGIGAVAVPFIYTPIEELKVCSIVVKECIFEAVSYILDNKL